MSLETISKLRLWIYRLIALLIIPSLFLFCFEAGLRFFKVGHQLNYTTTTTINGQDYYSHNTRFVEQFLWVEFNSRRCDGTG